MGCTQFSSEQTCVNSDSSPPCCWDGSCRTCSCGEITERAGTRGCNRHIQCCWDVPDGECINCPEILCFDACPTPSPTTSPTEITDSPSMNPTEQPTMEPTMEPTFDPTMEPTTAEPTTAEPTTSEPTTAEPTTSEPTTASPTTSSPTDSSDGSGDSGSSDSSDSSESSDSSSSGSRRLLLLRDNQQFYYQPHDELNGGNNDGVFKIGLNNQEMAIIFLVLLLIIGLFLRYSRIWKRRSKRRYKSSVSF